MPKEKIDVVGAVVVAVGDWKMDTVVEAGKVVVVEVSVTPNPVAVVVVLVD